RAGVIAGRDDPEADPRAAAGAGRAAQPEHVVHLARSGRGALPVRPGDGHAPGQADREWRDRRVVGRACDRLRARTSRTWGHQGTGRSRQGGTGMRDWNRREALLSTMAGALLGACSGSERRVVTGNATGVLHWGNGTEPQALDPHITTGGPESRIQQALLEGLVSKDPATLEPVPGMAESWEISEDGLVYIFHIRHDARWSDGTPLTAEDFRWSWWRGLQPAMANEYAYMLYALKNAEAYLTGKIDDFAQVGV